jgi:hypothetical protein
MELLRSKLHLKVQDHIKHSKRLVLGGGWPSGAHDNAIPRWEYLRQNKQDYLNYVIIFLREETMLFFVCDEKQYHTSSTEANKTENMITMSTCILELGQWPLSIIRLSTTGFSSGRESSF